MSVLLLLLLADVSLEVEVARALAQATLPPAAPQTTLPGQATLPVRELLPMPVDENPLRWWETDDPEQHALYRGNVWMGSYHHGRSAYWPRDPNTGAWGAAVTPPLAPPKLSQRRSIRAEPAQFSFSRSC